MAKGLIEQSTLTDIANAIREMSRTTDSMRPSEMADLIRAIKMAGALPEWITEMEFAQVTTTSTSLSSALNVPCSMESVPTGFYVFDISVPDYTQTKYRYEQLLSNGVYRCTFYRTGILKLATSESASVSLSNGVASFRGVSGDADNTYYFNANHTFNIIMWR